MPNSPAQPEPREQSTDLANFYTFLEATSDLDLDLTRLQEERPRMARLLTQHAGNH